MHTVEELADFIMERKQPMLVARLLTKMILNQEDERLQELEVRVGKESAVVQETGFDKGFR